MSTSDTTRDAPTTVERHSFAASDGVELSYCVWDREGAAEPQTLVLILHGIGFHAGPYGVIARGVDAPVALFAGLDFRGHGYSQGRRGVLAPIKRMLADIGEWVSLMRAQHPSAKVVLLAESMAGPYATLFVARNRGSLDGLVLIAPAMIVAWPQIAHPNTFSALFKMLRSLSAPSLEIGNGRANAGTGRTEAVMAQYKDEFTLDNVSPRYVLAIGRAIARVMLTRSVKLAAPVLIVHGARDNVLAPVGSKLLIRKFRSRDRRLITVPDAYHTMIWDSSSESAFAIIGRWLSERFGVSA